MSVVALACVGIYSGIPIVAAATHVLSLAMIATWWVDHRTCLAVVAHGAVGGDR